MDWITGFSQILAVRVAWAEASYLPPSLATAVAWGSKLKSYWSSIIKRNEAKIRSCVRINSLSTIKRKNAESSESVPCPYCTVVQTSSLRKHCNQLVSF